jgi:hypothetical protein
MLEVLLEVREPDLRALPVVEPKRPDAVERWFPPEVPKTPSPVAPCEPKSPGVEMPADSASRSEPTPVSSVAAPPIGRSFEDVPCEPVLTEPALKFSFCILPGDVTSISHPQFESEHLYRSPVCAFMVFLPEPKRFDKANMSAVVNRFHQVFAEARE